MNLEEILANKDLFLLKKKNELQKSDFSNFVYDLENKSIEGNLNKSVEVLIYETTISKDRNKFMFNQYKNGYVLNHSVGMRYIKLFFCYNTEDENYIEDKENWDKYYPMVLNKEVADKFNYFVAVVEAKNIEASSVVKGSNHLTPVLSIEIIDENTIRVKCAISPSNIIDSHRDCHIPNLWKKTIKENNYDLLLQEHDMSFEKVISDSVNDDFKVYTENITIKELVSKFGKNKKTQPLKNTGKVEPSNDTQKNNIHLFI